MTQEQRPACPQCGGHDINNDYWVFGAVGTSKYKPGVWRPKIRRWRCGTCGKQFRGEEIPPTAEEAAKWNAK